MWWVHIHTPVFYANICGDSVLIIIPSSPAPGFPSTAASVHVVHPLPHGYYNSMASNRTSEAYCVPSSSTLSENYSRSHMGGIPFSKPNEPPNAHSRASQNRCLLTKSPVSVCHSQRVRLCRYFLLLPRLFARESHCEPTCGTNMTVAIDEDDQMTACAKVPKAKQQRSHPCYRCNQLYRTKSVGFVGTYVAADGGYDVASAWIHQTAELFRPSSH
jgi:hypothetical protein